MDEDAQRETIAFLKGVSARAGDETPPLSTHISRIFFAGETVFKLKRAVKTAYLDFTTPQLRRAACDRELELNRRTAPSLYRRVRALTRNANGVTFDGSGEEIDAVIEMRRFDQANLFDAMAQRGALTGRHAEALAAGTAAFHARAEVSHSHGGAASVRRILETNETELLGSFLSREQDVMPVCKAMRDLLDSNAPLLDARKAAGKVRRCHGDLTLRNIALIGDEPTPFDCLEFDEALATIDVLYDLAFVIMDLQHRSRGDLANILFNRYLDAADEIDGLPLLPLFMAMRAIIRAHVTARMSDDAAADAQDALKDEARAYLALAREATNGGAPILIGIGGLSGSGKSTVAAALAPSLSPMPGARILSSDRIRKKMFDVAPTQRLPAEAYAPHVSQEVYARAREEAARCLRLGWPVICDAVFDRHADREELRKVALGAGARFHGFWLSARDDTLAGRVAARTGDPSDATVEVLRAQQAKLAASAEAIEWTTCDAAAPVNETAQIMRAALGG
jgi:aminoglycoside phosphotransferase family enzyme/predicted kinase